jgi:hypothetical protein
MAEHSIVEVVSALALAIGLAACAGLRAWLPLLLAGGLARTGWLELGPSFSFLASDRALLLFGIATVVEILADKVPAVDHALDMLSTPLRPIAGAVLASSALGGVADPLTAIVLGVAVGAPTALLPHAAKSFARAASTTFTAGLANPVLSVLEDVLAVMLFVLAVLVPLLVAAGVIALAVLVLRRRSRLQPAVRPA